MHLISKCLKPPVNRSINLQLCMRVCVCIYIYIYIWYPFHAPTPVLGSGKSLQIVTIFLLLKYRTLAPEGSLQNSPESSESFPNHVDTGRIQNPRFLADSVGSSNHPNHPNEILIRARIQDPRFPGRLLGILGSWLESK